MAREVKEKTLINARLAANYGGWMYCDHCQENIGYLCYATYDKVVLKFRCNCGNEGKVAIEFVDSAEGQLCEDEMVVVKNRLCCSKDQSPLMTILEKKVADYQLDITCKECQRVYHKQK